MNSDYDRDYVEIKEIREEQRINRAHIRRDLAIVFEILGAVVSGLIAAYLLLKWWGMTGVRSECANQLVNSFQTGYCASVAQTSSGLLIGTIVLFGLAICFGILANRNGKKVISIAKGTPC